MRTHDASVLSVSLFGPFGFGKCAGSGFDQQWCRCVLAAFEVWPGSASADPFGRIALHCCASLRACNLEGRD